MPSVSRHSSKPAKAVPHAPLTSADVRKIFYGLMLGMFLSALIFIIFKGPIEHADIAAQRIALRKR